MSNRTRIANHLLALARDATFYVQGFNANHDLQSIVPGTTPTVDPSSLVCDEINSTFQPDRKMGRRVAQQRTDWGFQIILGFNVPANIDDFVEALLVEVPHLAPTATEAGALLRLADYQIEHPPQLNANSGTKAVLTFIAEVGRA